MTTRSDADDTLLTTIGWWERRRVGFNLFLAGVGIPGLLLFFLAINASGSLAPGEDAVEPLALMAAPIGANFAYTAGWLVEGTLLAQEPNRPIGPLLMKAGLLFSAAVIFAPGLLWTIMDLVSLASDLLRL